MHLSDMALLSKLIIVFLSMIFCKCVEMEGGLICQGTVCCTCFCSILSFGILVVRRANGVSSDHLAD